MDFWNFEVKKWADLMEQLPSFSFADLDYSGGDPLCPCELAG
jgi:hypothetical protein